MPFSIQSSASWGRPAPGQEITIRWSFADSDFVDRTLMGLTSSSYVTASGARTSFTNYPDFNATITDPAQKGLVRQAFFDWDVKSGINFVEVADNVQADIRIGFYPTGNGLISQAENAYGAFSYWKGNDVHVAAIEINPNAQTSTTTFYHTVLHQIGHILGLDDTSGLLVSNAADVMNPSLNVTTLSADDIAGIRSLYGGEPPTPEAITQVARLYEAGLNRTFDAPGLNYWIDQRDVGLPLTSMASQFLHSGEFTQRFGNADTMSAGAFVNLMYSNVLSRPADSGGLAYWSNVMAGGMSREQVLISFADSVENRAQSAYLSGLAETQPGWWDLA